MGAMLLKAAAVRLKSIAPMGRSYSQRGILRNGQEIRG